MKTLIFSLIRWVYWYPFGKIIHRLPFLLTNKLSFFIVPIYYLVSSEKRKKMYQGLVSMYGGNISQKKATKLIYKTLQNDVTSAIEHLLYPEFNADFCKKNIQYKGLEHLNKALEAGKGVVLLHGHIGNPHMIMPALGNMGYKLHQLASRNPPEKYHGLMEGLVNLIRFRCHEKAIFLKEKLPVNFIYTDRFLRTPFRVLKRNEILAMALDGREGAKSINIHFLNHQAIFYTGVMRLILVAKPIVLPVFHLRDGGNNHTILVEHPFEIEVSENKTDDIRRNIEKIAQILETQIYNYPWLYAESFAIKDPFLKYEPGDLQS